MLAYVRHIHRRDEVRNSPLGIHNNSVVTKGIIFFGKLLQVQHNPRFRHVLLHEILHKVYSRLEDTRGEVLSPSTYGPDEACR